MCGLVALLGDSTMLNSRKEDVNTAVRMLSHRGPDETRVILHNNQILYGHARLAIFDVANGSQPLVTLDGRYSIVFNGAIYNYRELRKNLEAKGAIFFTNSDTEVLLQGLIIEREDFIRKLVGMFAFVFHDSISDYWLACRDHIGMKPLYYAKDSEILVFASEIKAIKFLTRYSKPNIESLTDYLTFQFYFEDETTFNSIKKVIPGTYIIGQGNQILETKTYWSPTFTISEVNIEDAIEQTFDLLKNSVELHLRADLPAAVYISGGIDSSLIAALASKQQDNLIGYHGYFNCGAAFDESHYAEAVARHIKIELRTLEITNKQFLAELDEIIDVIEEPMAGPGSISQFILSKKVSKDFKVILGGQGGDEIFAGYTRYFIAYLEQSLKGAITMTQEEGSHLVLFKDLVSQLPTIKNYLPLLKKFWADGLFEDMDMRYLKLMDRSSKLNSLLKEDIKVNIDIGKSYEKFRTTFKSTNSTSYINKMLNFDLKTNFQALLQIEDRVSMGASIESRLPLLDFRLIDYVGSLPPNIKFHQGETKYLLRKIAEKNLPRVIIDRKDKMGFPVPINLWMQESNFKQSIFERMIISNGPFDNKKMSQFLNNNVFDERTIWGILQLNSWWSKNC